MKLSTRMALAMVALVVLTALSVGLLSYTTFRSTVLPRAADRTGIHVRVLAAALATSVRGAREDILGFQKAVSVGGIVRAQLAGGVDPEGGATEAVWRHRVSIRFAAELGAKISFDQFGIIGADGRELIHVDRSGPNGAVHIAADEELQQKFDRPYLRAALATPPDQVYVSPVELNEEHGAIQVPYRPVLRVAARVDTPEGKPFGIVVINVDMQPPLQEVATSAQPGSQIYVVDDRGNYLVNPDRAREFAIDLGKPQRWQSDFPAMAALFGSEEPKSAVLTDGEGEQSLAGLATTVLAGGPRVAVMEVTPVAALMTPAIAIGRSTLLGGLISVLCAGALAVLLARSLTRPLVQMTKAVEAFPRDQSAAIPSASGEIGVLARAFARMMAEVKDKTASVEKEIAERRRIAEVLDNTINSMADPVLVGDRDANIALCNTAARRLMNISPGMNVSQWTFGQEIFMADGITPMSLDERPLMRAVRGETFENYEFVVQYPHADMPHAFVATGGPIRGKASDFAGGVAVYRDITEMRETERQLRQSQKMESVGQLTGGVAHDFNNILTVITGTIEILTEGVADRPDLAAVAKMIDEAAERGTELTRNLLAFSRRQPLQPRRTNVNELVVETARLLRPTLGENIEIESMLDDDASPALIDPSQLSASLLNLAINARDAMPNGGKLTFETSDVVLDENYAAMNAEVRPGPYVMIAVSDNGAGIPAAIIDKVFEPFFTTKTPGKGTGLGLSMVYGFVKQSEGHIKIYSEEGHGTAIKMYLPRATAEAEQAAGAVLEPIRGGYETILIVEDDALVRTYVTAQVKSLGYRTLSATNAAEALALIDDGAPIDLLFTDIVMPGAMNGRELADEACRRRPQLKVLFTSGYTENAIVHHGRLDPGVRLLAKPYRKHHLAQMIRTALNAATNGLSADATGGVRKHAV